MEEMLRTCRKDGRKSYSKEVLNSSQPRKTIHRTNKTQINQR
jgi:hypothetical protein